jgi:tRNA1(Val) A37 N6-methylase TrmN6
MEEMNSSTTENTTTFLIIIKNPPFYEARESSIGYYIAIGLNMSSGKKV